VINFDYDSNNKKILGYYQIKSGNKQYLALKKDFSKNGIVSAKEKVEKKTAPRSKKEVLEFITQNRLMAGLHTVTGGKKHLGVLIKREAAGIAELAQILIDRGIVPVLDNEEAFVLLRKDNPDAVLGYFIGNNKRKVERAIALKPNFLVGIEFLKKDIVKMIKAQDESIIIITVISQETWGDIPIAMAAGVDGIQFKPFKEFRENGKYRKVKSFITLLRKSRPNFLISGAGGISTASVKNVLFIDEKIIPAVTFSAQQPEYFAKQADVYQQKVKEDKAMLSVKEKVLKGYLQETSRFGPVWADMAGWRLSADDVKELIQITIEVFESDIRTQTRLKEAIQKELYNKSTQIGSVRLFTYLQIMLTEFKQKEETANFVKDVMLQIKENQNRLVRAYSFLNNSEQKGFEKESAAEIGRQRLLGFGDQKLIDFLDANQDLSYLFEEAAWMDLDPQSVRKFVLNYEDEAALPVKQSVSEDIQNIEKHAEGIFRFARMLLETHKGKRLVFLSQGADPLYDAARILVSLDPSFKDAKFDISRLEAVVESEIPLEEGKDIILVDEVIKSGGTILSLKQMIEEESKRRGFKKALQVNAEVMVIREHAIDDDQSLYRNDLVLEPHLFKSNSAVSKAGMYLDSMINNRGSIRDVNRVEDIRVGQDFDLNSSEYWNKRRILLGWYMKNKTGKEETQGRKSQYGNLLKKFSGADKAMAVKKEPKSQVTSAEGENREAMLEGAVIIENEISELLKEMKGKVDSGEILGFAAEGGLPSALWTKKFFSKFHELMSAVDKLDEKWVAIHNTKNTNKNSILENGIAAGENGLTGFVIYDFLNNPALSVRGLLKALITVKEASGAIGTGVNLGNIEAVLGNVSDPVFNLHGDRIGRGLAEKGYYFFEERFPGNVDAKFSVDLTIDEGAVARQVDEFLKRSVSLGTYRLLIKPQIESFVYTYIWMDKLAKGIDKAMAVEVKKSEEGDLYKEKMKKTIKELVSERDTGVIREIIEGLRKDYESSSYPSSFLWRVLIFELNNARIFSHSLPLSEEAKEKFPDKASIWNIRTNTLDKSGKLKEAILAGEEAVARFRKDSGARNILANLYFASGERSRAVKMAEKTLELDSSSDDRYSYTTLANFYFRIGESVKGEEIARKGIALFPLKSVMYNSLANHYLLEDKPDLVISLLDFRKHEVLVLDPVSHSLVARAFMRKKEWGTASSIVENALRLFPENKRFGDLIKKIKILKKEDRTRAFPSRILEKEKNLPTFNGLVSSIDNADSLIVLNEYWELSLKFPKSQREVLQRRIEVRSEGLSDSSSKIKEGKAEKKSAARGKTTKELISLFENGSDSVILQKIKSRARKGVEEAREYLKTNEIDFAMAHQKDGGQAGNDSVKEQEALHKAGGQARGRESNREAVLANPQPLFSVWAKGPEFSDELIYQARKLGFEGHKIEDSKPIAFQSSDGNMYHAPNAKSYVNTWHLYWEGLYSNIIQHAEGDAVYLWRESRDGYEFLMFGYGTGVISGDGIPVADISDILNVKTYRGRRSSPIGAYQGGGAGIGTRYISASTYLTRFLSVNNGEIRVVEKNNPGFKKLLGDNFKGVQTNLKLSDFNIDREDASGLIVQGFVPIDKGAYVGKYSPVTKESVLATLQTESSNPVERGSWQIPPAEGLGRLEVGDDVTIAYYKFSEKEESIEMEVALESLPAIGEEYFSVVGGGKLRVAMVRSIEVNSVEIKVRGGEDFISAVEKLNIKLGDTVKIQYNREFILDEKKVLRGNVKELPSSENQGVFEIEHPEGVLQISMAQIKELEMHEDKDKAMVTQESKPAISKEQGERIVQRINNEAQKLAEMITAFSNSSQRGRVESLILKDYQIIENGHGMRITFQKDRNVIFKVVSGEDKDQLIIVRTAERNTYRTSMDEGVLATFKKETDRMVMLGLKDLAMVATDNISEDTIVYLKSTKSFERLGRRIGFTGLGPDFEGKYTEELAEQKHDVRVGELARRIALRYENVNEREAEFIGLAHNFVALPYRHFTMSSDEFKEIAVEAGYSQQEHIVRRLEEEGFVLTDSLREAFLVYDSLANPEVGSDVAKIAFMADKAVGAVEDFMFSLKYGLFAISDVRADEYGVEMMAAMELDGFDISTLDKDFDKVVLAKAEKMLYGDNPNLSVEDGIAKIKNLKNVTRGFMKKKVFVTSNSPANIDAVRGRMMPILNETVTRIRRANKEMDASEATLQAIDELSKSDFAMAKTDESQEPRAENRGKNREAILLEDGRGLRQIFEKLQGDGYFPGDTYVADFPVEKGKSETYLEKYSAMTNDERFIEFKEIMGKSDSSRLNELSSKVGSFEDFLEAISGSPNDIEHLFLRFELGIQGYKLSLEKAKLEERIEELKKLIELQHKFIAIFHLFAEHSDSNYAQEVGNDSIKAQEARGKENNREAILNKDGLGIKQIFQRMQKMGGDDKISEDTIYATDWQVDAKLDKEHDKKYDGMSNEEFKESFKKIFEGDTSTIGKLISEEKDFESFLTKLMKSPDKMGHAFGTSGVLGSAKFYYSELKELKGNSARNDEDEAKIVRYEESFSRQYEKVVAIRQLARRSDADYAQAAGYGGIDFTADEIDIETRGPSTGSGQENWIEMNVPVDFDNIDPDTITGYVPVIFQIVPLTNLNMLLGLEEKEEAENLVYNK